MSLHIFPHELLPEMECELLSHIDSPTLVAFSHCDKYHYSALANEGIFKDRFIAIYRYLHPMPEEVFFPHFSAYYPDYCWKILCQIHPEDKPITAFNKTFLRDVLNTWSIDGIDAKTVAELDQTQNKLRAICGEYPQDPHSPIHRAWKAYERALTAYEKFSTQDNVHHREFLSELESESAKQKRKYDDLEKKRNDYEEKIRHLHYQIGRSENGIFSGLLVDQFFSKEPMRYVQSIEHLKHAYYHSNRLIDAPLAIEQWLNTEFSFPRYPELRNRIFQMLYHQCAQEMVEENWAEKHCSEYFIEFRTLLITLFTQANRFNKQYVACIERGIDTYVHNNVEKFDIEKDIPLFKRSLADLNSAFETVNKDTKGPMYYFEFIGTTIIGLADYANQMSPAAGLYLKDVLLPTPSSSLDSVNEEMKTQTTEFLGKMIEIYTHLIFYSEKYSYAI